MIEQSRTWLTARLHQGWRGVRLVYQQMKPKREKPIQRRHTHTPRTWLDQVIDGAFLVVTSLAFLVFLMASLPHVAYFIVTFEPQNPDGSLSEWWWMVAYLIAGAINITEFLLSVKFARDVRNATRGLPWYRKVLPTLGTICKYWPFILLIAGFSWAANLEHAEQFHSSMLTTAESVKVIIPFFQGKTWGDLNPYIVSAYPVLNIAYTFMFDASRSSEGQAEGERVKGAGSDTAESESKNESSLQPVSTNDLAHLLQTMHAMHAQQLQAMQEMQRDHLKATVDTLQQLASGGASKRQSSTRISSGEKQATTTTAARKGSVYEEPIKVLFLKNPHITAVEAGRKVGCSHVTAAAILKSLRPVKVTPVAPDETGESEGEAAASETA